MTISAAMLARLDQSVTVYPSTGYNSRGDVSYATSASTYRARVEYTARMVKGRFGPDQLARVTAYVGPTATGTTPTVGAQDKVVLPDGTAPKIIAVDTVRGLNGVHHQVVYLE